MNLAIRMLVHILAVCEQKLQLRDRTDEKSFRRFQELISSSQLQVPLVRLGSDVDGGYLVPDIMLEVSACFSPGVGNESSFENNLIEMGIPCYLLDYSTEAAPFSHTLLHFEKKNLGSFDGEHLISLEKWVQIHEPTSSSLLLQMDIEGDEYSVLMQSSDRVLQKFVIMIVEFHNLHRLMEPKQFPLLFSFFSRILHMFDIVHLHPNNNARSMPFHSSHIYPILEVTFLRKGAMKGERRPLDLPHPLDRPNVQSAPPLILDQAWTNSAASHTS